MDTNVEIRPSSRENVHHAVVYIRPPGSKWLEHAPVGVPFTAADMTDDKSKRDALWTDTDILLVYAPGSSPDRWPDGMAKLVPAARTWFSKCTTWRTAMQPRIRPRSA